MKILPWVVMLGLLSGCGKNPLAPPGFLVFGTGEATVVQRSVGEAAPNYLSGLAGVDWYSVTIDRVDISEDGTAWTPVLTSPVTATAKAGVVAVVGSTVGVRAGEYHGVMVWFGPRLHAVAKPRYKSDWTPDVPIEQFDQFNPRVFSTRDGSLAFPFRIGAGEEVHLIFAYDFTESWVITNDLVDPTIRPYLHKIILDKDPRFYPKITIRVSNFKG